MEAPLNEIKETKAVLINLVNAVNEKEVDVIPFEGSWTAGQLLEHVDKAVSPQVLSGNTAPADRPADEKGGLIKKIFLDFNTKFQSPDFIEPTQTVHDKDVLLDSLSAKFDHLANAVTTMNLQEECLDFEVPGMGKFTRMEWIMFYLAHTQRHMHQLKNIIAALQAK